MLTPDVFEYIKVAGNSAGGERRLADGFVEMLKERDIYGYEIEGKRYDTGDKFGFLKATIDYALKRPELAEKLKEFMKSRI